MTVSELIEVLQRHDPTRIVAIDNAGRVLPVDMEVEEVDIKERGEDYACVVFVATPWP